MANLGLNESTKSLLETVAVAPPAFISSTSFAGVTYQNWVYILTAIYTLLHILYYITVRSPKVLTCVICMFKNKKCDNSCKNQPTLDLANED